MLRVTTVHQEAYISRGVLGTGIERQSGFRDNTTVASIGSHRNGTEEEGCRAGGRGGEGKANFLDRAQRWIRRRCAAARRWLAARVKKLSQIRRRGQNGIRGNPDSDCVQSAFNEQETPTADNGYRQDLNSSSREHVNINLGSGDNAGLTTDAASWKQNISSDVKGDFSGANEAAEETTEAAEYSALDHLNTTASPSPKDDLEDDHIGGTSVHNDVADPVAANATLGCVGQDCDDISETAIHDEEVDDESRNITQPTKSDLLADSKPAEDPIDPSAAAEDDMKEEWSNDAVFENTVATPEDNFEDDLKRNKRMMSCARVCANPVAKYYDPSLTAAPEVQCHCPAVSPKTESQDWDVTYVRMLVQVNNERRGVVILEVHDSWAPYSSGRFLQLANTGFFAGNRFFKVEENFVAHFGISGDPGVSEAWGLRPLPEDPIRESNRRGYLSFAPDSRTRLGQMTTTEVFINLMDNLYLDKQGFAPFARIVSGIETIDSLCMKYSGRDDGPNPLRIYHEGNIYLERSFPELSFIIGTRLEKNLTLS